MQTANPVNFNSFTTGISLSVWYLHTGTASDSWPRIIDFGNGASADNFVFAKYGATSDLAVSIRQGSAESAFTVSGGWTVGKTCVCVYTCILWQVAGLQVTHMHKEREQSLLHNPSQICMYAFINLWNLGMCLYINSSRRFVGQSKCEVS
jgi:hypothetical protein